MRSSARASAFVVVWAVAVALTGCSAAGRPDAEVARAVEEADRQRLTAIVLASADDELPVALPVAGRVNATPAAAPEPGPQAVASVSGNGSADRFFSVKPEDSRRSLPIALESDGTFADDPLTEPGARRDEGATGRPHVRVELFRFTLIGRPVHLRCSIKNKHLMFGAKITL